MIWHRCIVVIVVGSALSGCNDEREASSPPPIRPVISMVAQATPARSATFTGSIQPRYSRELAFRIGGRVVDRNVDVGDVVEGGQVLASLDPRAQALAVQSLQGGLAAAEAQEENARMTRDRQAELVRLNATPQAQLDSATQQLASARSAVTSRRSELEKARQELGYTRLLSETDGIVTGVAIEVGQVAEVGRSAITVAQAEVREAAVDVAEEDIESLSVGDSFLVTLQIDPALVTQGRAREIAPRSDSATRTRRVLITLIDPPPAFRVGTTVDARRDNGSENEIRLPRTALLLVDDQAFVWVVDEGRMSVSRRLVTIDEEEGSELRVVSGIESGTRVVTAGVNSLQEGQAIKIAQELVR